MANGNLTPYRRGSLAGGLLGGSPGGLGGGTSLFDLHRQMNRLFDDLVGGRAETGGAQQGFGTPALEVHQTDDHLEITAELAGVKEDDIELTVEDGVLTLRGEKRSSRTDQEQGYSERRYGRFERSISLPSNIDEEKCSAQFRDGVLTVTLPKSVERQRGRRIPLGGSSQQQNQQQQLPKGQNDQIAPPRQQAAQENKGGDSGPSGQQR